jgi:Family of unknown function (DUF5701)
LRAAVSGDRQHILRSEFDRQVDTLVRLGHPQLTGVPMEVFVHNLAPLAENLADLRTAGDDRIPFVLVVGEGLVPRDVAVGRVEMNGRNGFTSMEVDDLKCFAPAAGLELPDAAYLLIDVDTGSDTRGVVPDDALPQIISAGRSPLTIDEGLALVTQFPGILRDQNCFSMLGSRCGDRRVPALWVSQGRPRLGWCWAAAPHTWLGSASCVARLGRGVRR